MPEEPTALEQVEDGTLVDRILEDLCLIYTRPRTDEGTAKEEALLQELVPWVLQQVRGQLWGRRAKDLAQDVTNTFLGLELRKVLRAWNAVKGPRPPYVGTALRNLCKTFAIDQGLSDSRETSLESDEAPGQRVAAATHPHPEDAVDATRQTELVRGCVDRLPDSLAWCCYEDTPVSPTRKSRRRSVSLNRRPMFATIEPKVALESV